MSQDKLPAWEDVSRLLTALLGRRVIARSRSKETEWPDASVAVATYSEEKGPPRVACVFDLAGAASLGGALTMIPVARVDEALAGNGLDEMLSDNLREVSNVLVSLLISSHGPLALNDCQVGSRGDDPFTAAFVDGAPRTNADLSIEGYTDGRMSFVMLADTPGS